MSYSELARFFDNFHMPLLPPEIDEQIAARKYGAAIGRKRDQPQAVHARLDELARQLLAEKYGWCPPNFRTATLGSLRQRK